MRSRTSLPFDRNDLCEQRSLTRIHGGAIIASGVERLARPQLR
jgi:DeoR/GlpR family transcriptional regulator of sugar metabolism